MLSFNILNDLFYNEKSKSFTLSISIKMYDKRIDVSEVNFSKID